VASARPKIYFLVGGIQNPCLSTSVHLGCVVVVEDVVVVVGAHSDLICTISPVMRLIRW